MLTTLAAYQDYVWFLAACGWASVAALALWSRRPGRSHLAAEWRWLLALALGGVALSAGEMWLHVANRVFFGQPRWADDTLVAAPLTVMLGAAAWGATRAGPGRTRVAWLATLAIATGSRYAHPLIGSALLGVVAFILIGRLASRRAAGPDSPRLWPWWCWLAMATLPLLSTTGVVAEAMSTARRWNNLSTLGTPAGVASFAAAASALWLLFAALPESSSVVGESRRRDLRRLGPLLLVWLFGGLAFADWCGRQSRENFESALLAQARVGAAMIDARKVASTLSPAFQLGALKTIRVNDGREETSAYVPFLAQSTTFELRQYLTLLRASTKHTRWAQLTTIRDGYLVAYAFDTRIPLETGKVSVLSAATPSDRINWSERRAFVEGPLMQSGQVIRASAPIITPDRRMLGWVSLVCAVDYWTGVQATARLQAFALVAAGVALALLAMFGRWRNLERMQALADAASAREADHVKTVFLAKVSHELRTPVQNILGYCELSLRTVAEAGARRHLQSVLAQGQLLVRLINDLIDLSAIQVGAFRLERRTFDLTALCRELTDSQQPAAHAKGLALSFITAGTTPALLAGDPDRLRQILSNLVGNALKYTTHGSVVVRLQAAGLSATGCPCTLSVEDTGPGIAPADQLRLFRPFGRLETTAHHEGTGLGLTLTQALCRAMQGDISVVSTPGHGSTFIARFVLSAPSTLPAGEVASPSVPAALRVLVADDNALIRELFQTWLTEAGAIVTTATDGLAACDRVTDSIPDVLVIDVAMPQLNGVEAARRLRTAGHLSHRLRIVGVSAHASAADREAALRAGMDAFLTKPLERQTLLAAVASPARVRTQLQDDALRKKLSRIFAQETPAQLQALETAVTHADFPAVARLAHLLRNSADVLQDHAFSSACERLESLASAAGPVETAFREVCHAAHHHLSSLSTSVTTTDEKFNPP